MFCHFRTEHTTFLAIFRKVHEFVQNSVFSPRLARIVILALGNHFLMVFSKVHEFVQNNEFSPRSASFVISALGEPFWLKSERVCAKQCFEPEIRTFSHFRYWAHHFLAVFSKVHEFVQNRRFQPETTTFCYFRTW